MSEAAQTTFELSALAATGTTASHENAVESEGAVRLVPGELGKDVRNLKLERRDVALAMSTLCHMSCPSHDATI